MKILGARALFRWRAGIRAASTRPVIGTAIIGMLAGQWAIYRDPAALRSAWNPESGSAAATWTVVLLVASALCHEGGHLLAAVARGDSSAAVHIRWSGARPLFLVRHRVARGSAASHLMGPFAQFVFASVLGAIGTWTRSEALVGAAVFVDVAAFVSLVPSPGSDGYRVIAAAVGTDDWPALLRGAFRGCGHPGVAHRCIVVGGLAVLCTYVTASVALLLEVSRALMVARAPLASPSFASALLLLFPAIVFVYWAVERIVLAARLMAGCVLCRAPGEA